MGLKMGAYWMGWGIVALGLLIFLILGAYGPSDLERIELPREIVANLDSSPLPMLIVAVPPPCQPMRPRHKGGDSLLVDTTRLTVLLFGDSMIEWARFRIARWFREAGYDLCTVIWPSSNLIWWAKSDTLRYFMETLRPDYVLISLGGNELFIPGISRRRPYLEKILQDIGLTPHVWIGPPNWAEDTGINDLLRERMGPGCFFESKRLSFDRLEDGAHPTPQSAYRWADSIAFYLRDSALVPVPLPKEPPRAPYLTKPYRTWLLEPHAP
jgi:hypothetical protein